MTNPTPPGQVPDAIDVLRAHAENKALRAQQDDAYDHGPQAETVEEAARDVGKWLNERPNRPLDLRHVAMLTHHAKRTPQPSPAAQAASSAVLKAIRKANMQLVRTGDNAFMLVPYKVATAHAAESVPAISDLPPLPDPDLRDVGTKPQDVKDFLNGYATEYARLALAARAPAESVPAPVLDSLLNIVINHEARATPAEVRSMAAELATYRAARAPAESVGRDAPEAALSPQVHLTRNTLLWWSELASINPQDLVPRIDAVLAANGVNK